MSRKKKLLNLVKLKFVNKVFAGFYKFPRKIKLFTFTISLQIFFFFLISKPTREITIETDELEGVVLGMESAVVLINED